MDTEKPLAKPYPTRKERLARGAPPEIASEMISRETVPIYMNIEIGRFDPEGNFAARDALAQIGNHWDNMPFGVRSRGSFSFEMDEVRFEVTVTPLEKP